MIFRISVLSFSNPFVVNMYSNSFFAGSNTPLLSSDQRGMTENPSQLKDFRVHDHFNLPKRSTPFKILLRKCSFLTSLSDLNQYTEIFLPKDFSKCFMSIVFFSGAKMARSISESDFASALAKDPNRIPPAPVNFAWNSWLNFCSFCFQYNLFRSTTSSLFVRRVKIKCLRSALCSR